MTGAAVVAVAPIGRGAIVGPGAVVGALAGLGVVSILWWVLLRRPRLTPRISPYLAPAPDTLASSSGRTLLSGLEPHRTPFPTLERLLAPSVARLAIRLQRLLGGADILARRLQEAGREPDVQDYRVRQVIAAAAGLAVGVVVGLVLVLQHGAPFLVVATSALAGAVAGVLGCDVRLTAAIRHRERLLLAELPTIAELLSLAVAAGEGPMGALERVSRRSRGELAQELRRTLDEVRAGLPLALALEALSDRSSLPPLRRFVDAIVVALERGTPLADVLRAQAVDVREATRRSLMETAGRKEISMMLPIVFLLLPVTVLFALYPGLVSLSLQV
ncbi:MAG: type II secretion system F family protein [Actinomycetes bacterium]